MSIGVELSFWASIHKIEPEEGCFATFYVMDTGLNQNNWRVTDESLSEAYPHLIGKTLGCIPGYRVNHVHEPMQVGRWIRAEKPGDHVLATAEVTDPAAWEKLRSGEWGPVSVVIRAYRVTCSLCGGDVTEGPDEHIVSGEGHEVIESFEFDRVDFVSNPAYPDAGLVNMGLPEAYSGFKKIAARGAAYQSNERRHEELSDIEQLQEQVKTLNAEKESLESQVTELGEELTSLKEVEYNRLLESTVEARIKSGIATEHDEEKERLHTLDASSLEFLRKDAEKLHQMKAASTGAATSYNSTLKMTQPTTWNISQRGRSLTTSGTM